METRPNKFSRSLTRDERKQLKDWGEVKNAEIAPPLFYWKASKGDNECRFIEVFPNALFETPNTNGIATADGVIIAVASNTGVERIFFFEITEYQEALSFYAKTAEILKNYN